MVEAAAEAEVVVAVEAAEAEVALEALAAAGAVGVGRRGVGGRTGTDRAPSTSSKLVQVLVASPEGVSAASAGIMLSRNFHSSGKGERATWSSFAVGGDSQTTTSGCPHTLPSAICSPSPST